MNLKNYLTPREFNINFFKWNNVHYASINNYGIALILENKLKCFKNEN